MPESILGADHRAEGKIPPLCLPADATLCVDFSTSTPRGACCPSCTRWGAYPDAADSSHGPAIDLSVRTLCHGRVAGDAGKRGKSRSVLGKHLSHDGLSRHRPRWGDGGRNLSGWRAHRSRGRYARKPGYLSVVERNRATLRMGERQVAALVW